MGSLLSFCIWSSLSAAYSLASPAPSRYTITVWDSREPSRRSIVSSALPPPHSVLIARGTFSL